MTNDRTITITRLIAAPIHTVFSYWTSAELIVSWYAPVDDWVVGHAEITPGVGGGYLVRFGPAPEGDAYTEAGTYTAYDEPHRLSWEGTVEGDDVSDTSFIDVVFSAEGDGTLVTVTETGLTAESADEHTQGWEWGLASLERAVLAG